MQKNNRVYTSLMQTVTKYAVRLLFIFFWIMFLVGFILLSHVSQYFVQERSLSVYMWADKIDESMIKKFEQETGIKVYVNYYESNEELVTKFEIGKDLNCDIILPSEYIVQPLARAGFLKKIDKTRCDFIDRIAPEFMHHYFDQDNEYSLPIYWDMLGLGYTKSYFEEGLPLNSWSLIFDKNLVPCKNISMVDDSREAIFLAMRHFCSDCMSLDDDQIHTIKKLFIEQKAWVGAYTDFQQGYFLTSKTYPLVVCQREIVARQMLAHSDLAFTVPDEGSMFILTNVVLCASSKKDDLIYQFLNYIYQYNVLMYNAKQFSILPVVGDVLHDLPQEYIGVENILPGQPLFEKLELFPNILTQKQINDVWIAFKSF
jgi:spermidine/putrescine transport system substrate-binding protein